MSDVADGSGFVLSSTYVHVWPYEEQVEHGRWRSHRNLNSRAVVSTLDVERSCSLTCGVGKGYRRAEVCLYVDWRLGVSVKQYEWQILDMPGGDGTRLRMVRDEA